MKSNTLYKLEDPENKSIVLIRFSPGNKYKTIEEFKNKKYPTYNIEMLDGWTVKNFSINPGDITNINVVDKNWKRLHQQIVNKIIKYCIKNKIKPKDINLYINNIYESLDNGCWVPGTDSELIALDSEDKCINISI